MRRFIIAFFLLAVIVAVVLFLMLRGPRGITAFVGEGSTELEQWCGRQLLALADSYLRPEFSYQSLDYEYPATVTLQDVALTDAGLAFITASSMRIRFTEIPKVGRPVVIESVETTDPVVRLIQTEDDNFIGFTAFIEPTEAPAGEDGPASRLSDAFAIRTISFLNGTFMYETPGAPAMVLDQITFDLTGDPEAEPGWYAFQALLSRAHVLELDLEARLNLDDAHLSLDRTELDMTLEAEGIRTLPPSIQRFAGEHELTGQLHLSVTGELPLVDPVDSDLVAMATLTDAMAVFGTFQLPVDDLDLRTSLADHRWSVERLFLAGLGGTADLAGSVDLAEGYLAEAAIDVRDVRLEQLIRQAGGEGPPEYAGRLGLKGGASGQLVDLAGTLGGKGVLTVEDGRLVKTPIIAGLFALVEPPENHAAGADHGAADLILMGDQLQFRNIDLVSASMAARGDGEVFFDSRIDFRLNAGPLEKFQKALGPLGELMGAVTDQLMKYHVTGTFAEPKFAAKPLGLGVGTAD